jgi:hypothetical protein
MSNYQRLRIERARSFDARFEFAKEALALFRPHPTVEMGRRIVANDTHPLILELVVRFENSVAR